MNPPIEETEDYKRYAAAALTGLLASGHFTHDAEKFSDSGAWFEIDEYRDPDTKETKGSVSVIEAAHRAAIWMMEYKAET